MSGQTSDYKDIKLSGKIEEDIALFKEIFKKDSVFRVKRLKARKTEKMDCALVYMDGMVDSEQLNDAVIEPILTTDVQNSSGDITEYIENQVLFARDVKKLDNLADIISGILYGEALLIIDGSKTGLNIDVKGWRTRGISEPQDERVLKGPREGFEEAALLNLAMIRRKLQTPDFCTEYLRVGRRTGTLVFICYLDSLADSAMVEEIKNRIKKIDIDGILDSNYIAELIRDHKRSLFKTNGSTERPDVVASKLLEGRIAVVVDGTPVVITFPYLFSENFQSDEDYYRNFAVSSVGRMLRYLCFFLAVSIPAVFIAVTTFHRELLPTSLAISVAQLRGGVPFSPFTECLLMIFVFEILKETGARMPQSLGHALGIVGGLVVGQAAVDARIISTPMLIVIALSGISGLMIPKLSGAVFYYRFIFLFLGVFFG
ncbi:MAG: spore germination protein, partial [Clostridia bacterium]|nr:spore germination protein [Clostridia bacterium]